MNKILMIFLDGVGIGEDDAEKNPFFRYGFRTFEHFLGSLPSLKNQVIEKKGNYLFPSDACMGVEGLPQSGTGQVSIFCGINAPAFVGKHFGPFPFSTTIPVIKEKNIFIEIKSLGYPAAFANAYPEVFFRYLESGRQRLSTTSLSCRLSNIKLNTIQEVKEGMALTAEITNERWNLKLGYDLPVLTPEEAALRLINIANKNKFTLYEFFLTDHIGHGRYEGDIPDMIQILDEFLFSILNKLDRDEMTLIICSDHGNFEDCSIRTHTTNPALTLTAGKNAEKLAGAIKDLSQIKDALLTFCE